MFASQRLASVSQVAGQASVSTETHTAHDERRHGLGEHLGMAVDVGLVVAGDISAML